MGNFVGDFCGSRCVLVRVISPVLSAVGYLFCLRVGGCDVSEIAQEMKRRRLDQPHASEQLHARPRLPVLMQT